MNKDKHRKAKVTPADREAALRLRAIWLKSKPKLTQEEIAARYGDKTQGAVSQYLKGTIPLNVAAVLRFAQIFGCRPQEIRNDLPELQNQEAPADAYAQELWSAWPNLDVPTKEFFVAIARGRVQLPKPAEGAGPFPEPPPEKPRPRRPPPTQPQR